MARKTSQSDKEYMNQSTSFAQVATNLLTVLQGYTKGIRLLLVMFVALTVTTNAWGAEEIVYTLTPAEGSNNSYAGNCDIVIDGVTWNLTGNSQEQPWRIGGKSLTKVDRAIYSKTPISNNISKITIQHGTASSITVNSVKLVVSTQANGTGTVISELTSSFAASSTMTFTRPDGKDWTNAYYKIIYNVTVTNNSNKYLQFTNALFYSAGGNTPDPIDPEITFLDGEYTVGGAALDLSTLWSSNSTGDVTYSVTDAGTTGATIEGSTFTATAAGICTVQASQEATATHNAATATATITVTAPAGGGGGEGDCIWTLVTNTSNLVVGDEIVIAAKDYNYALSTTQNNNNRGQASITKNNSNITFGNDVQIFTLLNGKTSGTFAFQDNDGINNEYLYAASSSNNYLKTESTLSANSSWEITIASDGTATIVAQGSYTRNTMQYNQSSSIFACYGSASQKALAIYKEVCTGGTTQTSYAVTIDSNIENGTVTANPTPATAGTEIVLTATPNKGYQFSSWTVTKEGGGTVEVTNNIFTMPASNVIVSATFVTIPQLATPTNLQVTNISCNEVTLSWDAVTNISSYTVAYRDSKYTNTKTKIYTNTTTVPVAPGTTYAWTVQAIGNGTTYADSQIANGNSFTTSYKITYDVNGGSWTACADGCVAGGEDFTICSTVPTKTGYDFMGWSTANDETAEYQASTTITNVSETITLYAVWKLKTYTITWVANGQEFHKQQDATHGTDLAVPSAPDPETYACDDKVFVGWTATPIDGSTDTEPADLFKSKTDKVENAATTYYAVFATKGSGGGAEIGTVVFSEDFSSFTSGNKMTGTQSSGTGRSIYGSVSVTYSYQNGTDADTKIYGENNAGGTSPELLVGKKSSTFTISGIPSAGAAKLQLSYKQNAKSLTSNVSGTGYSGGTNSSTKQTTTTIITVGSVSTFNLTFTGPSGSDNARLDDICITVEETSVSYSNYVTNCCALAPVTNLTVSGTTVNSATLTWTAPSPTTGITKLQVRNAETDEVVVDNIVAINTTTATITGLTECTSYQYYVVSVGEDCEVVSNIVTAQPFGSAKTVNYDYNGGNGSPASFTTNCTNQTITLPDATRTGYDFNGWYTDATGGTRVGGANDTYEPATSPVTLYAQWTKQIYSISFHANGGSGTMVNQQADENDKIAKLNANQFTRTGYVFVGWNTSTSGTGTAYIDQQTNITLAQNLTLYAQWAAIVTLNDAGNVTTTHPETAGGSITLEDGANACDPYEFVGWTAVATGDWNEGINEPTLVPSPYSPTEPTTLYAVYKIQDEGNPNAFKLSFEGSNGKTYYVDEYSSSPLRGYSNISKEDAVTFIRTKMYPTDDTRYYLYMEEKGEYLYYNGYFNSTSSTPDENQGWIFHTVGDQIKLQSTYSYDPEYLSFSDRDDDAINMGTNASGSLFNMLPAVTSTYVAAPLCNQEITITFETGNGDFVANAPATNPLTVSRGDVITLPTCEYPGYEFMGWMKDEQQLDPSDIIGTYYTGDYTVDGVSSTITFYAYYKAIPEEVEFTGKDDVELLMYYYDGTANYYYASSLDGGNGELPSMQNCFNATTWTFTNVGNMQYHIQDETGKYLGAVHDNDNDLSLSNTPKVWNFTLVNGLWKMVCEDSPSRALMYISTGKKFANAAISNEGNGAYSYVTLGICPYPTYTTNPVLSQGFSITNTAMVTSASGQKVKATSALTLETRNIELPCTFTIAAPNITFYDNTGAEVNQLTASAASEQFELHFAYQPTAENTMEYPTVTITDDEMKTYTIKNRISARSLPAVFVIAAKTGNSWVALNANITSTGTQAAPLIMVDNIALPTKATITPNTTKYQLLGLQTDKPSNANSRFKNNGAAIHLYSTNVSKVISASTSTDNKKTYINADAAHDDAASSSNCLFYEWQLQTNDLVHYTLVNSNTTNTSNTKLGYSATYAQWGMYQTGNNVIQEVLLLPIEKDITEMDVEVMEWGTNSMALRFGSEAPATVDITLGATTTKGLSLVNLNSGNTSDIYKVEGLSLAGNDCEALLITDATDASKGKLIRKPILVSGDKNGSDYTIAPTRDVCMHSDIVILNGGRLTANEANSPGSHVDFANIYVYPGGKLVLDEKSLGVKQQVYLRGGYSWLNQSTYALPEVYLNGDINFNGSGNMIYDYYIQNQKYYQFALPYDVQLAKVTDESGADDFPVWVKHYNGALRAADAYATSWEWYPSEEGDAKAYFKEGEGYIIAAKPRQVGNVANRPLSIIRFPLGNKAFNSTNGIETDLTITTTAHGIDGYKAGTITANNVGWNFVGNPFMATWKGDIGHKELAKHPDENNWDGSYHWVDSDVKYITIMSPEDGSDYAQYIASNTELKPFFPFYIQETADGGGTINFAAANRVKKAPVLWNVEQDEREAYIQIEIAMDAVADQTGVFVSNKYSDEIDFDDYGKMFGSSTDKPKVWLVHDNTRLAFEAMTENRATGMTPLGYRAPQDGKYMLVLNDEVSQLNNVESIYLTDYKTGVTDYDLTLSTYEFESTTTLYNDTRFAIRVVMRDNTQGPITGVENVNTDNGQIHKFIYQGKIYILHHGVIYDATGKRVITINK